MADGGASDQTWPRFGGALGLCEQFCDGRCWPCHLRALWQCFHPAIGQVVLPGIGYYVQREGCARSCAGGLLAFDRGHRAPLRLTGRAWLAKPAG